MTSHTQFINDLCHGHCYGKLAEDVVSSSPQPLSGWNDELDGESECGCLMEEGSDVERDEEFEMSDLESTDESKCE